MRRTFRSQRRRTPIGPFGFSGFLRPGRRHEEDQAQFLERMRHEPRLRREYRTSVLVQMGVVGALFLACLGLIVQTVLFSSRLQSSSAQTLAWLVPVFGGLIALLAFRRLLRLVSDYRRLRDD